MSGRNLRDFVVSHRSQYQDGEEQNHLVTRMMMGMDSNRYKKINYQTAKEAASRFRGNAASTGRRLAQLKKRAHIGKERSLIKQHYPIWQESYKELRDQLRGAEFAYQSVFTDVFKSLSDADFDEFINDIEQCDLEMNNEIKKFSEAIVFPVQQLINDLKIRLHHDNIGVTSLRESLAEDGDNITNEINSVKVQCTSVSKWLTHQRTILENDLTKTEFSKQNMYPTLPALESAIPIDVVFANCPDENLKSMMLRQFVDLHTNYLRRLNEEKYRLQAVEQNVSEEFDNFWVFTIVYDLYHKHMLTNTIETIHSHIIDMLTRLISGKTKAEILELESYFLRKRYSKKHCEVLVSNYYRDFSNLNSSALCAFADARSNFAEMNMNAKDRERQQKICTALHEKVMILRAKQEEILDLETEMEEKRRAREMEEREKDQWLENERRHKMKKEISRYRHRKIEDEKRRQMELEKRLQILKTEVENQRKIDQERVNYRVEKQKQKDEIQLARERSKTEEKKMQEKRMDDLRQTVAVVAESDPVRLVSDTISSKAHLGIGTNEDVNLQTPLFNLHGYSQKEIEGDIRLRVEAALRNAGIHETDYARRVISKIPPPTQPRRDNDSTALQYMFTKENI